MSKTHSVMTSQMQIDGVELPQETETDTTLPDRNAGEYERLRLEQRDAGFFLSATSCWLVDDHPLEFSMHGEVEFLHGDWDAFQSGETVSLRYTERGLSDLRMQTEQQSREQLWRLLTSQFGGDATVETQLTEFSNSVIRASGEEIVVTADGPMRITANCTR